MPDLTRDILISQEFIQRVRDVRKGIWRYSTPVWRAPFMQCMTCGKVIDDLDQIRALISQPSCKCDTDIDKELTGPPWGNENDI